MPKKMLTPGRSPIPRRIPPNTDPSNGTEPHGPSGRRPPPTLQNQNPNWSRQLRQTQTGSTPNRPTRRPVQIRKTGFKHIAPETVTYNQQHKPPAPNFKKIIRANSGTRTRPLASATSGGAGRQTRQALRQIKILNNHLSCVDAPPLANWAHDITPSVRYGKRTRSTARHCARQKTNKGKQNPPNPNTQTQSTRNRPYTAFHDPNGPED